MIKQFLNKFVIPASIILSTTTLQAATESCNTINYSCPSVPGLEAGQLAPWTVCDGDPKNPGKMGDSYGTDAQGGTIVCVYSNLHLILKNVCQVGGYWEPAETPITACGTYLPYAGIVNQNSFYLP